jgi:uncharacterized peroxidase-related enzyme
MALRAGGTETLAQQLKSNYRRADVTEAEMALMEFAELLTVQPSNVRESDIGRLREVGWTDEDIVDIVHQTALFSYMNRVADGLGIELEHYMETIEERDGAAVDLSGWGHYEHNAEDDDAGA